MLEWEAVPHRGIPYVQMGRRKKERYHLETLEVHGWEILQNITMNLPLCVCVCEGIGGGGGGGEGRGTREPRD